MSNPIINLSSIYKIFYNFQTVNVTNVNGLAFNTQAMHRVLETELVDDLGDGTYGIRTKGVWLLFKSLIPDSYIPQSNTRIIETTGAGTTWYVSKIENMYFGNIYKLYCESIASQGVTNETVPYATVSSTTTTSTTTTSSTTSSTTTSTSTSTTSTT